MVTLGAMTAVVLAYLLGVRRTQRRTAEALEETAKAYAAKTQSMSRTIETAARRSAADMQTIESLKWQVKKKQDKLAGLAKKEFHRQSRADKRRRDLRFDKSTSPRGRKR